MNMVIFVVGIKFLATLCSCFCRYTQASGTNSRSLWPAINVFYV